MTSQGSSSAALRHGGRRGFTLVELTIVLAIIGIVAMPFAQMTVSMYRKFTALAMASGLKNESDQAGYRIVRLAAASHAWHLETDNHGVIFRDGTRVHWQAPALTVTEQGRTRTAIVPHVTDLTVVRHGATLVVNVSVAGAQRTGGTPVTSHSTYEYPAVEELK